LYQSLIIEAVEEKYSVKQGLPHGSSPVGIRIPKDIKRKFNEYCDKKGLRKSYLLSKIIEEKLLEFEEDEKEKIN